MATDGDSDGASNRETVMETRKATATPSDSPSTMVAANMTPRQQTSAW